MNMPLVLLNRRRRGSVAGFSPAGLFALAEPGVWYDPSDLTTLFTDSAGTTPVTTPGDRVGLMLDKSKGLVLGSELVGSLTAYANASINTSSGVTTATCTSNGSYGINLGFSGVAGVTYRVLFEVVTNSVPRTVFAWSSLASSVSLNAGTTLGAKSATLIATAGGSAVIAILGATAGETFSIRNISVRELPGNHATQSTSGARPTYGIVPLGGRRNLLTFTEQFDNAAWTKQNGSITSTSETDPLGGATADKFTPAATPSIEHRIIVSSTFATSGGYTLSMWVKPSGYSKFGFRNGAVGTYVTFDLSGAGSVIQVSGLTASIAAAANGFYRIEIKDTSATVRVDVWPLDNSYTTGSPSVYSYTGDGTSGVNLWGAQLELGSTASAYQRVGTAFDVTESGVQSLSYLSFDGVDDFMVTPTITPGIDKAQIFAGVRKLSDAASTMIVELSAIASSSNGSFYLTSTNSSGSSTWNSLVRGTAFTQAFLSTLPAPSTAVAASLSDIAGDSNLLRLNGAQVAQSTIDLGAGNFLAYPLYIGRRNGTSLPFNGQIYSLVVRFGANLDAGTITNTETWVNGKTGAYT